MCLIPDWKYGSHSEAELVAEALETVAEALEATGKHIHSEAELVAEALEATIERSRSHTKIILTFAALYALQRLT